MRYWRVSTVVVLALLLWWSTDSVWAQERDTPAQLPPAPIINDEGGPVAITGTVSYSNVFFTQGVAAPMIILEDQAGFIDRNEHFIFPVESQTLGQITSDFYTSPFSYTIALPLEPQGTLRDVDNDGEADPGVMVFAVAYWTNTFGDPFLEERDLFGGGWSTAYASTRVSTELDTKREIVGGKFIVYAADDEQGFPADFGDDGLLFTADDPMVRLPAGYTLVDMDVSPFLFDRSRYPQVDLIEPETAATADFSDLSYSQAFDAMLEKLQREYAFTDYKGIDWDALGTEFRPRFVAAEENGDADAYRRALYDFIVSIPDGHMSGPFLTEEFRTTTEGGLGMAIRELDDGRVIANFILADGPADQAGVQLGAEILTMDGQPIADALAQTRPWSAPFSTDHVRRLQQLRYLVRSPIGATRTLTYRNPDEPEIQSATLEAISEQESFRFSSLRNELTGFELPVEYRMLDEGYAYAQVIRFSDNELLTVQLWERLMRTLNQQNVPGLIIDMRQNTGGSGFLADQMAAYFFDEPHELGNAGFYNEEINDFYFDERSVDRFYLPADDLRYDGEVVVLIGPDCNSACEFFAYDMTIDDRAAIVGQYPTAGLGGSIDLFLMPEGESVQFTAGRAVDMNGEIHIEGKGVAPTVRVPVTEKILLQSGDPVLDAAIDYLLGDERLIILDGGAVGLGDTATGELTPNTRVRYTLQVDAGTAFNIYLSGAEGKLDTVLRLYSEDGDLLLENDDSSLVGAGILNIDSAFEGLTLPAGGTLTVEVAAYDDALTGVYMLRIVDAGPAADGGTPLVTDADAVGDDPGEGDVTVTESITPTATIEASGPEPTATPQVFNTIGTATVNTGGGRLRVRAEPNDDAAVIGFVGQDSVHGIVGFSDDGQWVRILVGETADEQPPTTPTGWIAMQYVSIRLGRSP